MAAGHTRVVLNVDFTTCSPAKLAAIGFVDDDAVSAAEGTFVGKDVVDDLHSEVVVRAVEPSDSMLACEIKFQAQRRSRVV